MGSQWELLLFPYLPPGEGVQHVTRLSPVFVSQVTLISVHFSAEVSESGEGLTYMHPKNEETKNEFDNWDFKEER